MNDSRWITFAETVDHLRSLAIPSETLISVYRKRKSVIENVFEGVILVSRHSLASELRDFQLRFVPHQGRRRLIHWSGIHFLGMSLRRFARLRRQSTEHGYGTYVDAQGKLAAESKEARDEGVCGIEVKLRADILMHYCEHPRLIALWVTDSVRYSERELDEFRLHAGRKTFRGTTFCYCQWFGVEPRRQPMRIHSHICGKRVLF
jgi:hypothetical protein